MTGVAAPANRQWFDVDRTGLQKILKRKGIEFALYELVQNAWDESGVTRVQVDFTHEKGNTAHLVVGDNAPEGFRNISDAYTLFAESYKKADPGKRGRFNIGEKLVLALCNNATVTTTKGQVEFGPRGRTVTDEPKTDAGSVFECRLPMSGGEYVDACEAMRKLIPPSYIDVLFNGEKLEAPTPVATFDVRLPTELADSEGMLRKTWRKCTVNCYPLPKESEAFIYEMGIPVVEHDCAFNVDVMQKVPLTLDRENVSVQFLRALQVAVFNNTRDMLDAEDMNASWVAAAISSPDAKPEAVKSYLDKRFGEKRVSFDPSDPEANKRAVSEGYAVVHSGYMSKGAWDNVKDAELILPAGKVTPSNKVWAEGENGEPKEAKAIPVENWTLPMQAVAEYSRHFAKATLGIPITVKYYSTDKMVAAASYGGRTLSYNKFRLGNRWFDLDTNQVGIDDMIIHELAHELSPDHLSDAYYHALTKIGALAMKAVREKRLP